MLDIIIVCGLIMSILIIVVAIPTIIIAIDAKGKEASKMPILMLLIGVLLLILCGIASII